jgi:hypothetical protein
MRFFSRLGFGGTTALLWFVSAVGFFGFRLFTPLWFLALPFWIPGLIVLGADEVQERYGYWGEPFYDWLLSFPCALLYAWLIHRRVRRIAQHEIDDT